MLTRDLTPELKCTHDSASRSEPRLERIWQALTSGRYRVVDRRVTAHSHCFRIAASPVAARREPLPERKLQSLVAVLLGHRQKAFAIETDCAQSTLTTHLGDCLETFGFHRRSHRLPLLLVAMTHALFGKLPRDRVQVEEQRGDADDSWLVRSYRPEIWLSRELTESETAVVSQRVVGDTYAEIAQQRGTSTRTVANQIASAYQKLHVSGRLELLCYLASRLEPLGGPNGDPPH